MHSRHSMNIKCEPASGTLHISVKELFSTTTGGMGTLLGLGGDGRAEAAVGRAAARPPDPICSHIHSQHISINMSIYLSIYLSISIYIRIYLSMYLSISIYISIYLSFYLYLPVAIYLSFAPHTQHVFSSSRLSLQVLESP